MVDKSAARKSQGVLPFPWLFYDPQMISLLTDYPRSATRSFNSARLSDFRNFS